MFGVGLAVCPHRDILEWRLWLTVIADVHQLGEFTVQKQPKRINSTCCNKMPITSQGLVTHAAFVWQVIAVQLRMLCDSLQAYSYQKHQEATARL